MALQGYINQCRRLLHDANGNYWSDSELTSDINEARKQVALDSGSVRSIVNFYLSLGQEYYPFNGALSALTVSSAGGGYTSAPTIAFSGGGGSGATATASISSGTVSGITITANGTGYTAAPTVTVTGGGATATATITAAILTAVDILNISVNWGNSWITLDYAYFTAFQAKARYYRSITGQPAVWSKGPPYNSSGQDYFYIFQIPSASYQCDVDAILYPDVLIDDTTVEQLQYPYTDRVQYYASYLAKYKQQNFDESARFLQMYDEMMRRGNASRVQRRIPSAY